MLSTYVNSILEFVANAGPVVYAVVAIAAIAEGAAFVGLVFPAETTLIVAGAATATGHLKLSIFIPIAIVGAIVGDSIGYEIGRKLGPTLRTSKLGQRVKREHWDKAEAFVHKHGPWAVFLGRFVAVLRALVPAIAETMKMRYSRFLIGNAAGGAIWATAALIAGRLASDNLPRVEHFISRLGYGFLTLVIIVLVIIIIRQRRNRG